ncbi:MAG: transposase, partial [Treponema sp.]|nr:transposase [Treponema sp.]
MLINLSRQNMCSWQQKVYKALLPLENQFRQELKKGKFLQMDETPLEVMKVNGQEVRAEYWDDERHRKKETEKEKTETQKTCHLYHYAGNNPITYTDPNGEYAGLVLD